jgi:serine/threonine-protein kinase HipA
MTTSKAEYKEAFVWIWLPGETQPVVAGVLTRVGSRLLFNYGKSYLRRQNAIAIYLPELPLQSGDIPLAPGLSMPGSIRDASPDAWGRRVLINRKMSVKGKEAAEHELSELTYLLESGSDRAGALDFQLSADHYLPRGMVQASIEDLLRSAEQVEKGVPLSPELDSALQQGTSLGGARPKALLASHDRKYVAKFSMSTDLYNVVKAEFIAMRLAVLSGLTVAPVRLERALGRDVLLVERFDREQTTKGWIRKAFVSALTLFELDELMVRHTSYETLAEIIRHRFEEPQQTPCRVLGWSASPLDACVRHLPPASQGRGGRPRNADSRTEERQSVVRMFGSRPAVLVERNRGRRHRAPSAFDHPERMGSDVRRSGTS